MINYDNIREIREKMKKRSFIPPEGLKEELEKYIAYKEDMASRGIDHDSIFTRCKKCGSKMEHYIIGPNKNKDGIEGYVDFKYYCPKCKEFLPFTDTKPIKIIKDDDERDFTGPMLQIRRQVMIDAAKLLLKDIENQNGDGRL